VYPTTRAQACEPRPAVLQAVAFLLTVASLAFLFLGPQAAHASVTNPAFPRLAVWWPNNDTQSAADRANSDWIAFQNYDAHHVAELRAINPSIVVLGSTSARELNYYLADYNHAVNVELRSVSTDWILTQVGSTLLADITNSATSIPVGDVTKFRANEMALVDHELVHIESVGTSSLTVTRGQVTPTASHAAGTRIASVVSNWPGSVTMDISANCPKRDVGHGLETWGDWNARRGQTILQSADWDGLLIDCLDSNPHWMVSGGNNRSIDQGRTNTPVTDGYAAFDAAWNAGAVAYGNAMRAAVGSKLLIGNGNMRNFNVNGNIFEEYPYAGLSLSNWKTVFVGPYSAPHASYPEWMAGVTGRNLTMVQTYGAQTNYQLMRFGLTSALMNDGYFSYALSSSGHARNGIWNYDEFDNAGAGRGYLGQPTGAMVSAGSNVYRRDFQGGIALVNPDSVAHTVQLGGTFRKINGTQDHAVNDGSLATAVTLQPRDGVVLLKVAPALPAGTMVVAGGVAQVTSPDVAVASVVTGANDMRIDPGNGTFGAWTVYAASAQITLAGTPSVKTVRAEYRNAAGTIQLTDTVELVAPAPVVPAGDFVLANGAPTVDAVDVAMASSVANASEMRVRVDGLAWSAWKSYAASSHVTLPATDGDYVVSAEYRSTSGGVLALTHPINLTLPVAPPAPVEPPAPPAPVEPPAPTDPPTVTPSPTEPPAPVDPPAPVEPPAPVAAVTLQASATTLIYGQSVTLNAFYTPASPAEVRIERLKAGSSVWTAITIMTTDANGAAHVTVTPLVTTDYRVVAVATNAVSSVVRVSVQPRATIRSSKRTVRASSHVTVSGTVTTVTRATVVLQRRTAGGAWKTIRRLSTSASGNYHAHVRFSRRGTYSYRVIVTAAASHLAGTSRAVRIRVR
jgi:hypothetical protein